MKKKISLLLCTLALALGMTACGELKGSDEIAGRTVSDYKAEISSVTESVATLGEAGIEYNISYLNAYAQDDESTALIIGLLEDYKECFGEDLGDYKGLGKFSVDKSGKTVTSTIIADYSKRDVKLTFVYSTLDTKTPTAMNAEPVYTLAETMKKAALNTVMGILIVFVMLVVMSAVIKCFEVIPKIEKKLKESKETAENVKPVATSPVASSNNETDDLQLVAVIAAAIAASTGASTDSFVVRSIKKR
ncbi:MAG: OadG family protein [Pseudobutyrivibrio sp.]|nr:OadG family protein [Pseudobutyrivibrio sp.]